MIFSRYLSQKKSEKRKSTGGLVGGLRAPLTKMEPATARATSTPSARKPEMEN